MGSISAAPSITLYFLKKSIPSTEHSIKLFNFKFYKFELKDVIVHNKTDYLFRLVVWVNDQVRTLAIVNNWY